jgi:hypothetical protein
MCTFMVLSIQKEMVISWKNLDYLISQNENVDHPTGKNKHINYWIKLNI